MAMKEITEDYLSSIVSRWHRSDGTLSLNQMIYIATGWTEQQVEDWIMTDKIPSD